MSDSQLTKDQRLLSLIDEVEKHSKHAGTDRLSHIWYCNFCSYSEQWIKEHGHGERCLITQMREALQ